ncbi:MAG: RNA polymerase sigma factor [Gammaproteobacteria bacterium]|nr:RNA polymerase sigma factor [Gammaproteobacteria bacterium]NNF60469.1 RNA polymerase sigma factor [Gammaproteobacteria bacterium]
MKPARRDAAKETALVRRAVDGDMAAFEELYRDCVGRIYAVCLRMTADRSVAEDCTQSAFVRAWQKLDRFEGRSAFSSWLHRIAVNEVLSRHRSDTRRRTHLEVVSELPAGTDIDLVSRDAGVNMDLEAAVQSLPNGARETFVLFAVYGYSHQEIADTLGVAVGTCKAQVHRARKLLRARLEK